MLLYHTISRASSSFHIHRRHQLQFAFVRDDGTSIFIPRWLLASGIIGFVVMFIILYFNYVSPSVYAAGYEARIAIVVAFASFLHCLIAVAAASTPGMAVWPARYVK